jgi:hypothetical protein
LNDTYLVQKQSSFDANEFQVNDKAANNWQHEAVQN